MKLIFVDQHHGHTRTIVLKGWLKGLLTICMLGTPVAFGYLGYQFAVSPDPHEYTLESSQGLSKALSSQADALLRLKQKSKVQLESLRVERQHESASFPRGVPQKQGWLASGFGLRTAFFNGQLAWHGGVDFATAVVPADSIPLSAGVVNVAGRRQGFGRGVAVNHGDATRYAHAETRPVAAVEIIPQGQQLAVLDSSGRSAGLHADFDVYQHGRIIDPATYIHRTPR